MNRELYLFNTMGKKKELFAPIEAGRVKMYSCGPTVYSAPHIGNMRAYVFSDIIKRVLLNIGYKVEHIINITDVGHLVSDGDEGEDKLEKASKQNGRSAYEIANYFSKVFMKDMESLSILNPNKYTFATDYIKEQIDLIKILEEKGYTYIIGDGVYFDISKYDSYTKLAGLDLEGSSTVTRTGFNEEKRNKADFALWKFSPQNEKRQMEWGSPWGVGFPGWHVECSAMAKANLGEHIDIHTGGVDHISVHHTNEKAQSECAYGGKFVNYWMHVNFLNTKEKMSKSKGNVITVGDVFMKGYDYNTLRFFYLLSHYRSEVVFSYNTLDMTRNRYKKLLNKAVEVGAYQSENYFYNGSVKKVESALLDDLNTPKALSVFGELITDISLPFKEKANLFNYIKVVLGLEFAEYSLKKVPLYIKELALKRNKEKKERNYSEADKIREYIYSDGFLIKDERDGIVVYSDGYEDLYIKT